MLRHFFYISIILCVFPACQVTQVSVPDAFDPELKASENIQSASAEIRPPSVMREPSGLSGGVGDESFSADQTWFEEMITAPKEENDGSQNVYGKEIYMGAINNNTGPCVLLESERSDGWFANMRFLSRYGIGHALNSMHRRASEPGSVVAITTAMNPQDAEPDDRKIPPITVFGVFLSLIPWISVFGFILSGIALVKIYLNPETYKGEGLAIAGLLTAIVVTLISILTFSMEVSVW